MKRTGPNSLAVCAVAICTAGLPTAATAQDCVAASDLSDAVVYAVPFAVKAIRSQCADTLAVDGFLLSGSDAMLTRYESASDAAWPGALRIISRFAEGNEAAIFAQGLAELDNAEARPLFEAFVPPIIAQKFKTTDCAKAEQGLELLAPLPPENTGGLVAFLAQMSGVDNPSMCLDLPA